MNPRSIPVFFLILVIAATLMSGCADEPAPAPARTPVPKTLLPTTTVAPTPTLSAECQDLLAAADADVAFMDSLAENKVYSRVYSLANTRCTVMGATDTNQLIADGPKPGTPALVQARKNLLSAAGYCIDPESSASQSRTRDDMEKYIKKMSEYGDLVYSCTGGFDRNVSASLITALEEQGSVLLQGTGNQVGHFTAADDGMRMFGMTYSGSGSFSVSLQDGKGTNTALHASSTGPFSGKKSERLDAGNYKLDVKADGPWTISIFNP